MQDELSELARQIASLKSTQAAADAAIARLSARVTELERKEGEAPQ